MEHWLPIQIGQVNVNWTNLSHDAKPNSQILSLLIIQTPYGRGKDKPCAIIRLGLKAINL